ncbi:hypothetical protein COV49_03780 [Candidatus Falkowbacteria bacterium CG11_big_fil_rev_8_21_14_0_20_39_10]|uniref:DUF1902 domain-containing protein n=1 Tax=Candidatus Falkowbacteria bacterium CG11_big_fil_rev_8_21_14_0_20_39_10 TaxID=1974570 RepID=A0A2M6K8I9_9BACT|nr:MAG: hypothetical protein COV49_03780 [Candidatus Falkowbacteria bacterium CG11_big_fil_rev_8_21_14_0_20_39_10]
MSLFRLFFPQKNPHYIKREYNIPDKIDWEIQLNKNGLVAVSKDLPGLVTNANNPRELLEMINDAVLEYFNVSKFDSDYIFDTLDLAGHGTVRLKQAKAQKQYA